MIKIVLNTNYRSTKPIIQILNDMEYKMNTDKSIYSSFYNNKKHINSHSYFEIFSKNKGDN